MNNSIMNVLSKFANSFDTKNWQDLEETLSDFIECDYTDLRGVVETCSKHDYVKLRKQSLNQLKTQHLFSNFVITQQINKAQCQLNAIIYRIDSSNNFFNSHAIYYFKLIQFASDWKITSINQKILWNEGDASIHFAAKS